MCECQLLEVLQLDNIGRHEEQVLAEQKNTVRLSVVHIYADVQGLPGLSRSRCDSC